MRMIEFDLLRLREVFTDYQALAANEDSQYQQWSPVLNPQENDGSIAFSLDLELPENNFVQIRHNISGWLAMTSEGVKWAIYTRRRYESVLANFQKWNLKLKEIATPC